MAEVTNELMYEVLKQLQIVQSEIKGDTRDIKARLASLESYIATMHGDTTRQSLFLDQLQKRIERIETRLNINDA
jgi:hypothetical protein